MQLLSSIIKRHNERSQALLALTIASILWGITTPIIKWSLISSPPLLFAFYRFLIAGIVFTIIARPKIKISPRDIPILIFSLLIGTSIHIVLAFYGIKLSTALNAAFISSASPFLTLLAGVFFLKERLKYRVLFGGILGLIGMGFLVIGPLSNGNLPDSHVLGNFLLICSILCWIGYEIVGKKYLFPRYSIRTITFYAFLVGTISTFPFVLKDLPDTTRYFTNPHFYVGVFFSAIISSICAFSLWQWGISKIEVSRFGFFIYLDPVTSSILAILILGESFTPAIILGAFFVLVGLYIAERKTHFPHIHLLGHYRGTPLKS